MGMTLNMDER